MAGVWQSELELLIRRQNYQRDTLVLRTQVARQGVERLATELEALEATLVKSAEDFRTQVEKLLSRHDDPEVWVRNYGAGVYAFHSPEQPCGWARDARSFKRMLLSDALDRGYGPCKSCGRYVQAA